MMIDPKTADSDSERIIDENGQIGKWKGSDGGVHSYYQCGKSTPVRMVMRQLQVQRNAMRTPEPVSNPTAGPG